MKRILLLGGGHAHVHVLKELARQPIAGAEVLLVAPFERAIYSGMVPGVVAGHYRAAQAAIPLAPLAAAAGVPLVEGRAVALDPARRVVHLADGRVAEYELLSLDVGATQAREAIPGAREHGLFLRPIEHFVRLLDGLVGLARQRVLDVVVVGAGAAGVELALALAHRLAGTDGERARVALVTGGPRPLAGYPPRAVEHAERALARSRITVFRQPCARIEAGSMLLASGARLACDAPVIATGVDPHPWLAASGLAVDARGFVATGPTLQSRSHPAVFAAGDCASRDDVAHPRSGVYAVRAGPPLARNLRLAAGGGALLPYQPRRRTLNLVSCGARRAILAWGPLVAEGRWAWWWKDRIDRGFIAQYTLPAGMPGGQPAAAEARR